MDRKQVIEIRKRMGLSQNAFAIRLGVTWLTVNRWENGKQKPSPLALEKLLKVQAEEMRRKNLSELSKNTIIQYRWEKNNPEKVLAERLSRLFPGECEIEYVCPHPGPKVNHHPDFSQPFVIQKLCRKCHYNTFRFKK